MVMPVLSTGVCVYLKACMYKCVHMCVCVCKFMPDRRVTYDSYSMSRSVCPLAMAAEVEQLLQKGDLITHKCWGCMFDTGWVGHKSHPFPCHLHPHLLCLWSIPWPSMRKEPMNLLAYLISAETPKILVSSLYHP